MLNITFLLILLALFLALVGVSIFILEQSKSGEKEKLLANQMKLEEKLRDSLPLLLESAKREGLNAECQVLWTSMVEQRNTADMKSLQPMISNFFEAYQGTSVRFLHAKKEIVDLIKTPTPVPTPISIL